MNNVSIETVLFRRAAPADVAGIVALVNEAYRAPTGANAWTSEATLIAGARIEATAVRNLLAEANSVLIVGEHAGAIVACIHIARDEPNAHIGLFAVARTWQGRGLGRRLLAHAENGGTRHGCTWCCDASRHAARRSHRVLRALRLSADR